MRLYVEGLGLRGPGLVNWPAGREVLAGRAPYVPAEVVLVASELLPVAERRRVTDAVKLALIVGSEAMTHAQASPQTTRSVFVSSGADGATITAILETLATKNREVSPTRFHNSVHNAPAGYWSIATQSREASTSLCAYDDSFAAGFLEASVQALTYNLPVLLVSYDIPYPGALGIVRPIAGIWGIALVLSSQQTAGSICALSVKISRSAEDMPHLPDPDLDIARAQNPSARGLPLLSALAQEAPGRVNIPYVAGNVLEIEIAPMIRSAI
ncbi:MAG: 3-oxoacyl-ACP synthase [Rhodospirillales bacterium]|nr:3-oxoacyl-ACP synthase [Rhodospirillales bacterium]